MPNATEMTTSGPERDAATGFRDVDRTGDISHYVRFPEHASGIEQIRQLKRRSYQLMQVQLGQQVLDVGCGLGDDVRALAGLVGRTGRVVGVDASEAMVNEARRRSEGRSCQLSSRLGTCASSISRTAVSTRAASRGRCSMSPVLPRL